MSQNPRPWRGDLDVIDDELAATLLHSSPDALFLVAPDGGIVVANRSAEQLFGYPIPVLQTMSIDELTPMATRDEHRRIRTQYARHPEPREMGAREQLFAERVDGALFPVEISLSPVDIGGVAHTIATVRDVTDRQLTRQSVALLQDRERIARDLHDMVIQRLFAAGMSLQAVIGTSESPMVVKRINDVVSELDATIQALRSTVFRLGQPEDERSLTAILTEFVGERAAQLGFEPTLRFTGDIDGLPDHVSAQLLATIAEALSNIARHAHADDAFVHITRSDTDVELRVVDNGRGIASDPQRRSGITNMASRAEELGGRCSITAIEPSGTQVRWIVPT